MGYQVHSFKERVKSSTSVLIKKLELKVACELKIIGMECFDYVEVIYE
jgi:hypothetical protein